MFRPLLSVNRTPAASSNATTSQRQTSPARVIRPEGDLRALLRRTIEEPEHVGGAQFRGRPPQERKQPAGAEVGDQTIVEGEEHVGGQATFRFGAAAAPLQQERGEERVPGVEDVPLLQFFPDLPPRRDRSARHAVVVDHQRPISRGRQGFAGRIQQDVQIGVQRRARGETRRIGPLWLQRPDRSGISFLQHVLRPQPLHCASSTSTAFSVRSGPAPSAEPAPPRRCGRPATAKAGGQGRPAGVTDAAASPSRPVADCSLSLRIHRTLPPRTGIGRHATPRAFRLASPCGRPRVRSRRRRRTAFSLTGRNRICSTQCSRASCASEGRCACVHGGRVAVDEQCRVDLLESFDVELAEAVDVVAERHALNRHEFRKTSFSRAPDRYPSDRIRHRPFTKSGPPCGSYG